MLRGQSWLSVPAGSESDGDHRVRDVGWKGPDPENRGAEVTCTHGAHIFAQPPGFIPWRPEGCGQLDCGEGMAENGAQREAIA